MIYSVQVALTLARCLPFGLLELGYLESSLSLQTLLGMSVISASMRNSCSPAGRSPIVYLNA